MATLSPLVESTQVDASPTWAWQRRSGDVDEHAAAQIGWRQHYDQLGCGRFDGLLQHVQLPGLRLVREETSLAVHQRGDLGGGAYGLALSLELEGAPAHFHGQPVARDAMMVGRSDELDLVTPDGFGLIAVVVDADLLHPLWERMYHKPPSAWWQQQLVLPARPVAAQALRALHLATLARLCAQPNALVAATDDLRLRQWRDDLLIEWLELLPERVGPNGMPTVIQRKQLVDRARQCMLAGAEAPVSMLQLCRELGVSRRKLNYCFQDVLGSSPLKYMRALRLNGARRALRTGLAQSVQEAAGHWGFSHMGQFSRDYRRQFGELPSRTLKSAGPTGAGLQVRQAAGPNGGDRPRR